MDFINESYGEWKLNEATLVWTKNNSSRDVALIFKREFLPTVKKIGLAWKKLTYNEYNRIITALSSEDLKNVINFFTSKGYKQPHPVIKKMQQDIMSYMDIKTFQNAEDQSKPFDDGIFGIATAKALLDLDAKRNKKYFIDARRGDVAIGGNVTKKKSTGNTRIGAVGKSDSTNVQSGVKHQPMK